MYAVNVITGACSIFCNLQIKKDLTKKKRTTKHVVSVIIFTDIVHLNMHAYFLQSRVPAMPGGAARHWRWPKTNKKLEKNEKRKEKTSFF